MAKGTKGIRRVSVPGTFPYGRQIIDKIASSTGIYGPRAGGSPPINAVRLRSSRASQGRRRGRR